ncbi:hypothetical protein BS50DRAFT_621762 [Corynespora cassiicola Philippines]|uniref:Uncharacterized protein n=1 Tax=Corynespora cassiicola Philippines TaxID=1448308 RepID=A0A2T2NKN2_CORCC|nr:hypothetical protein BS50DRAFT_621762 [Corynespora cassiicola Philippines]
MLGMKGLVAAVAALSFGAAKADFMVYTEPPIPTNAIPSFARQADASSWTSSVYFNAFLSWGFHTRELGDAYETSSSSAASEIAAFVASASNYSIPAGVTETTTTMTFFSAPDWYSALPTGAREFKESQVADQFSIIRQVIDARATTASSTGGVVPTAMPALGPQFAGMAAAVAAAFL